LLRAFSAVAATRLALSVLPLRCARHLVAAVIRPGIEASSHRLVWAVRVVSPYVPRATCLTQAVALHSLLGRAGHESCIEIGVAKDAGNFAAHAWVVCGGQVVIGESEVGRYSRLMTLASPFHGRLARSTNMDAKSSKSTGVEA